MKILKEGNKINTMMIGVCQNCNAIIEADFDETNNIKEGSYNNDWEDYSWEDCPSCNKSSSICFHYQSSKTGERILVSI